MSSFATRGLERVWRALSAAPGFLVWLVAWEKLPAQPHVSSPKARGWRWLLTAERLPPPTSAPSPPAQGKLWRFLFGREELPPAPQRMRGSRPHFLAWLVSKEDIGDPKGDS